VEVDNPVWLAPLAGITVPALRRFHRRLGAGLAHTEMVSALGLAYGGRKTRELLSVLEGEGPLVVQLFGPDAPSLAEGARLTLAVHPFQALEINMACPMPKVVSKGSGAAMLKDPDLAARAVALLKGLGVSVWVKARVLPGGFEETLRFCGRLFEAGLDLLLLHGRTSPQRYEGRADVEQVIRLSRAFPGRVVGSGDVFSPDDALRYLEGGCVAVLLARGFVRDPLLALRCARRLGLRPPGDADLKGALLELGDMLASHEGERTCLILVKRMVAGALKGHPHDAERRNRVMSLKSWGDLREFILAWPL